MPPTRRGFTGGQGSTRAENPHQHPPCPPQRRQGQSADVVLEPARSRGRSPALAASRTGLRQHSQPHPGHFTIYCLPDRKSTRLNSSHVKISYAVFCLKKKKK